MNKNSNRKFIFKMLILLTVFSLAVTLAVTATYSRYITESNYDIGFSAESYPQILLDGNEIEERALIQVTQWQQGAEQITASFTLSKGETSQDEDTNFCIRVFVTPKETDAENQTFETENLEITLLVNNEVYISAAETLSQNAALYKENQTEGQFYCFYESTETAAQLNEHIFNFAQGESAEFYFTLNVHSSDISSEQILIYVESFK